MASGLYSQHVNNKKMLYLRNTIIILMLVTLAVCCLFPLFYMIVNSFGPAVEAASSNRSVFPTSWSLDSYKAFFSFSEYSVKWLANTFVVSACQVLGNVVFASLAGYAFAKLKFKGKNFLFNLILIGMMIPVPGHPGAPVHPDRQQVPSVQLLRGAGAAGPGHVV